MKRNHQQQQGHRRKRHRRGDEDFTSFLSAFDLRREGPAPGSGRRHGNNNGPVSGAPRASLTYSTDGSTPNRVCFSSTSTRDTGDASGLEHTWQFNDGTDPVIAATDACHTFPSAGTYPVELMVRDPLSGIVSTITEVVTVGSNGGTGRPTAAFDDPTYEITGGCGGDDGAISIRWSFSPNDETRDASGTPWYQSGTLNYAWTIKDASGTTVLESDAPVVAERIDGANSDGISASLAVTDTTTGQTVFYEKTAIGTSEPPTEPDLTATAAAEPDGAIVVQYTPPTQNNQYTRVRLYLKEGEGQGSEDMNTRDLTVLPPDGDGITKKEYHEITDQATLNTGFSVTVVAPIEEEALDGAHYYTLQATYLGPNGECGATFSDPESGIILAGSESDLTPFDRQVLLTKKGGGGGGEDPEPAPPVITEPGTMTLTDNGDGTSTLSWSGITTSDPNDNVDPLAALHLGDDGAGTRLASGGSIQDFVTKHPLEGSVVLDNRYLSLGPDLQWEFGARPVDDTDLTGPWSNYSGTLITDGVPVVASLTATRTEAGGWELTNSSTGPFDPSLTTFTVADESGTTIVSDVTLAETAPGSGVYVFETPEGHLDSETFRVSVTVRRRYGELSSSSSPRTAEYTSATVDLVTPPPDPAPPVITEPGTLTLTDNGDGTSTLSWSGITTSDPNDNVDPLAALHLGDDGAGTRLASGGSIQDFVTKHPLEGSVALDNRYLSLGPDLQWEFGARPVDDTDLTGPWSNYSGTLIEGAPVVASITATPTGTGGWEITNSSTGPFDPSLTTFTVADESGTTIVSDVTLAETAPGSGVYVFETPEGHLDSETFRVSATTKRTFGELSSSPRTAEYTSDPIVLAPQLPPSIDDFGTVTITDNGDGTSTLSWSGITISDPNDNVDPLAAIHLSDYDSGWRLAASGEPLESITRKHPLEGSVLLDNDYLWVSPSLGWGIQIRPVDDTDLTGDWVEYAGNVIVDDPVASLEGRFNHAESRWELTNTSTGSFDPELTTFTVTDGSDGTTIIVADATFAETSPGSGVYAFPVPDGYTLQDTFLVSTTVRLVFNSTVAFATRTRASTSTDVTLEIPPPDHTLSYHFEATGCQTFVDVTRSPPYASDFPYQATIITGSGYTYTANSTPGNATTRLVMPYEDYVAPIEVTVADTTTWQARSTPADPNAASIGFPYITLNPTSVININYNGVPGDVRFYNRINVANKTYLSSYANGSSRIRAVIYPTDTGSIDDPSTWVASWTSGNVGYYSPLADTVKVLSMPPDTPTGTYTAHMRVGTVPCPDLFYKDRTTNFAYTAPAPTPEPGVVTLRDNNDGTSTLAYGPTLLPDGTWGLEFEVEPALEWAEINTGDTIAGTEGTITLSNGFLGLNTDGGTQVGFRPIDYDGITATPLGDWLYPPRTFLEPKALISTGTGAEVGRADSQYHLRDLTTGHDPATNRLVLITDDGTATPAMPIDSAMEASGTETGVWVINTATFSWAVLLTDKTYGGDTASNAYTTTAVSNADQLSTPNPLFLAPSMTASGFPSQPGGMTITDTSTGNDPALTTLRMTFVDGSVRVSPGETARGWTFTRTGERTFSLTYDDTAPDAAVTLDLYLTAAKEHGGYLLPYDSPNYPMT